MEGAFIRVIRVIRWLLLLSPTLRRNRLDGRLKPGHSFAEEFGMPRDCPAYALEVSLRSAPRLRYARLSSSAPLRMTRLGEAF